MSPPFVHTNHANSSRARAAELKSRANFCLFRFVSGEREMLSCAWVHRDKNATTKPVQTKEEEKCQKTQAWTRCFCLSKFNASRVFPFMLRLRSWYAEFNLRFVKHSRKSDGIVCNQHVCFSFTFCLLPDRHLRACLGGLFFFAQEYRRKLRTKKTIMKASSKQLL